MPHGAIDWVEIPAKDLEASPRFYEKVFGWKIRREPGWETYPMFMDAGDKMGGGFDGSLRPVQEGGVLLYITVDEIEGILPAIEKNGGTIVAKRTLISDSVGWWARFLDPSGNLMGLFESARKD